LIPPDGGREDGEFAEDLGKLHAEVNGEEAAERRTAQPLIGGALRDAIAGFDEGLKFFDEEAAVLIGFAAAKFAVARGSVLVEALLAGVVDADDYKRLDGALGNEGVSGFTDAPILAGNKGGGGIEEILAVFEIQDRESQIGTLFVDAGKVDD
jgi:hypothetical protein